MGIEVTGLDTTAAALLASEAKLLANVRKAVQVTCLKIKKDAQQRITGYKHLPRYPYSITYDTNLILDGVEGEVGPDKGRPQGPLGNVIEYGTSKNHPIPHLGPALDANAADLVTGVEIAVQQAL